MDKKELTGTEYALWVVERHLETTPPPVIRITGNGWGLPDLRHRKHDPLPSPEENAKNQEKERKGWRSWLTKWFS